MFKNKNNNKITKKYIIHTMMIYEKFDQFNYKLKIAI